MPPAARTGMGATASTTSGTSTIVETVPVWPPASVPWATIRSTPELAWRTAWATLPASAATTTSWAWARSIRSGGGGTEGARDQAGPVGERHVEQRLVALRRHVEPGSHRPPFLLVRYLDAVAAQEVVEELLVLDGEQRVEGDVEPALRRHRRTSGEAGGRRRRACRPPRPRSRTARSRACPACAPPPPGSRGHPPWRPPRRRHGSG